MGRTKLVEQERGLELMRRACADGSAKTCGWVGLVYGLAVHVELDLDEAARYLIRACDLGELVACEYAAPIRDPKVRGGPEAYAAFDAVITRVGCRISPDAECAPVAIEVFDREDVFDDVREAAGTFDGACAQGDELSCIAHSILLATGRVRGDPETGIERLRRSCEKWFLACSALGRLLLGGRLDRWNRAEATKYLDHSCRQSHVRSCLMAGRAHLVGWSSSPSMVEAGELLQMACDGLEQDCHPFEVMTGVRDDASDPVALEVLASLAEGDPGRALDVAQLACTRGTSNACLLVGILLRRVGSVAQQPRARILLTSACERRIPVACHIVAQEPDAGGSDELLTEACEADWELACFSEAQ